MRSESRLRAGGAQSRAASAANWRLAVPHLVSGRTMSPGDTVPGPGRIPDAARMRYPHCRRDVSATPGLRDLNWIRSRPPQSLPTPRKPSQAQEGQLEDRAAEKRCSPRGGSTRVPRLLHLSFFSSGVRRQLIPRNPPAKISNSDRAHDAETGEPLEPAGKFQHSE